MEILSIGKDTADGRKLLNYRAPKNAKQVHCSCIHLGQQKYDRGNLSTGYSD